MAIRVKHRVWVLASEDTTAKNKLFSQDPELSEVISDGFDKQVSGVISIAAAGNENLHLLAQRPERAPAGLSDGGGRLPAQGGSECLGRLRDVLAHVQKSMQHDDTNAEAAYPGMRDTSPETTLPPCRRRWTITEKSQRLLSGFVTIPRPLPTKSSRLPCVRFC